MLGELNELIKTDEQSQTKFDSFKAAFYEGREQLDKISLKRARMTAMFLGSATVLSLLFLLFSFVERTNAEEKKMRFETQIHQLEQQLKDCEEP